MGKKRPKEESAPKATITEKTTQIARLLKGELYSSPKKGRVIKPKPLKGKELLEEKVVDLARILKTAISSGNHENGS